jgi:hypothetical protein
MATKVESSHLVLIEHDEIKKLVTRFVDRVATISDYVSANVERFILVARKSMPRPAFFRNTRGRRRGRRPKPIVSTWSIFHPSGTRARKPLVISAVLTTEWDRARAEWNRVLHRPANEDNRVPTFVSRGRGSQSDPGEATRETGRIAARTVPDHRRRGTEVRAVSPSRQSASRQARSDGSVRMREQSDHETGIRIGFSGGIRIGPSAHAGNVRPRRSAAPARRGGEDFVRGPYKKEREHVG